MIKEITCTNSRGDTFSFGRQYRIIDGLDLSNLGANVNYSDNTSDGSAYQNTKLKNREFDISFKIAKAGNSIIDENRRKILFTIFNPKNNPFKVDVTTETGEEYFLNANLEGLPYLPTDHQNNNPAWQKGLLQFSCNDPFIYNKNSQTVDVATWIGDFEFPLEIPEEGIEMGHRTESLIANVYNGGQDISGMLIRFKANGTVINPSLLNVNTYEEFKLNYIMQGGDLIEVNTYQGKKSIDLIRNNVRKDIFSARVLKSKFLQLDIGDNLFRYDAESGLENLEIQINFTPVYLGV